MIYRILPHGTGCSLRRLLVSGLKDACCASMTRSHKKTMHACKEDAEKKEKAIECLSLMRAGYAYEHDGLREYAGEVLCKYRAHVMGSPEWTQLECNEPAVATHALKVALKAMDELKGKETTVEEVQRTPHWPLARTPVIVTRDATFTRHQRVANERAEAAAVADAAAEDAARLIDEARRLEVERQRLVAHRRALLAEADSADEPAAALAAAAAAAVQSDDDGESTPAPAPPATKRLRRANRRN